MASVIGVLVVHGIGIQKDDFAKDFISEMNDRLTDLQVAPDAVVWEPTYWADLLNDREAKLWNDLSQDHDLDWVTVRKFFINFFADAIAYQRKLLANDDMYRQIHRRIHHHLANLRSNLGAQDKPLMIVAHSLGALSCRITSGMSKRTKGSEQTLLSAWRRSPVS